MKSIDCAVHDLAIHSIVMDELKQKHAPLLNLISGRPIHYLDVPMYGNVGDLLIMAGALKFFEENAVVIKRKAMYFNYDEKSASSDEVLVFQGGGNFGDIYGPFQDFRERVIAARKDCRIIILPQTIHFSSPANFEATKFILSQHPDLHICVRDERSRVMALEFTKNVYLMPDMAQQLWHISSTSANGSAVLQLRRRDSEKNQQDALELGNTFDWDDLVGPFWRFFLSNIVERIVTQATLRLKASALFGNWLADAWIAQANRFVLEAIDLFSKHDRVESDRLHAHILACLLAKRNLISDNSYGKNTNYIQQWTSESPLVKIAAKSKGQQ